VNLFQWITLPVLALLCLRDCYALFFRHPRFRRDRLLRWLVWTAAFTTIANPLLTWYLAKNIGIDRGTDLVLYIFVLSFLGTSFYFYAENLRLHRQLTTIIRHIAMQEAKKEPEQATPS
jgi:small membrane protein